VIQLPSLLTIFTEQRPLKFNDHGKKIFIWSLYKRCDKIKQNTVKKYLHKHPFYKIYFMKTALMSIFTLTNGKHEKFTGRF
jgi:hypothetical protein